jgi:hypothetical protein
MQIASLFQAEFSLSDRPKHWNVASSMLPTLVISTHCLRAMAWLMVRAVYRVLGGQIAP